MIIKPAVLTIVLAAIVIAIASGSRPDYAGIRENRADAGYIDSNKCVACHPGHHDSWARTHHSRMTQEARSATIQGDFERNNTLDYQGVRARMERRGDAYFMTFFLPDGRVESNRITKTVGSRRVEQYITEQNGQHWRLPLAYDLVNQRWMSLNGSFFHPDGMDYFKLRSTWDGNCVFCHNVKAQPNFDLKTRRYETEVAELGIACGACHGPAGQHAGRAGSPLTRTLWRLGDSGPRDIINPSKLEPERSLMVCGHCHGQRIPEPLERMQEIIGRGDPYNSGDDLARFYQPVRRETKVGEFSFANRFWANGSPRLTAYEYQGILRSACFNRGERNNRITCLTCHSMHEGDPKGQITAENRTNKPCLSCHQQYEPPSALTAHTGHQADSEGSSCYNCHMPRVVYGIMAAHRTHDITVPDPQLTHSQQVPNACNQCHLDRSVNWAVTESRRLWPEKFSNAKTSADSQFDLPEGPRALMAGDALARALAAEALGGGGPGKPDAAWTAPWLVEALRDDYPIIRFFASAGLSRFFRGRTVPDYLDPTGSRNAADYYETLFDPAVRKNTSELARRLRSRRSNVDIEVGE